MTILKLIQMSSLKTDLPFGRFLSYESKENVDVDLNRLGKVNLCCCTVLPLRRMELWYGILNQQITDRRGNFVYIATR